MNLRKAITMSILCGCCRNDIEGCFGFLYRFERTSDGKLRYPDQPRYVPPNSAVCDICWHVLPKEEMIFDSDEARADAEMSQKPVFAYLSASGVLNPLIGFVDLTSIQTWDQDGFTFVSPEAVYRYFPNTITVIDEMEAWIQSRQSK